MKNYDEELVRELLGLAMEVYDALDEQKIKNMNECRVIRAPLKDIKQKARDAEIPMAAFNGLVKAELASRKYDKALEASVPEDPDDKKAYDRLIAIATEGDLFEHSAKKHASKAETTADSDDEKDVRPAFLREKDEEQAHIDENVTRLKRGVKGMPSAKDDAAGTA